MELSELLIGVLGAVLGFLGSTFAYSHGYMNTERLLYRQRRAETARSLISLRYCISDSYSPSEAEASEFNRVMGSIPFDFAGDDVVLDAYSRFIETKTNSNLLDLLEALVASSKIEKRISRIHLEKVLSINGS